MLPALSEGKGSKKCDLRKRKAEGNAPEGMSHKTRRIILLDPISCDEEQPSELSSQPRTDLFVQNPFAEHHSPNMDVDPVRPTITLPHRNKHRLIPYIDIPPLPYAIRKSAWSATVSHPPTSTVLGHLDRESRTGSEVSGSDDCSERTAHRAVSLSNRAQKEMERKKRTKPYGGDTERPGFADDHRNGGNMQFSTERLTTGVGCSDAGVSSGLALSLRMSTRSRAVGHHASKRIAFHTEDNIGSSTDSDEYSDSDMVDTNNSLHPSQILPLSSHGQRSRSGATKNVMGEKGPKVQGKRKLKRGFDWTEAAKPVAQLTPIFERCSTKPPGHPCPVLEIFSARWSDEIGCIYCIIHGDIIPGDALHCHWGSCGHPGQYENTTRDTFIRACVLHLGSCCPSLVNQSQAGVLRKLPTSLHAPLHLLAEKAEKSIRMRYKCPESGCASWIAVWDGKGRGVANLQKHIRDYHGIPHLAESVRLSIKPQLTQQVCVGQGKRYGHVHCFILPQNQPLSDIQRPLHISDQSARATDSWPTDLGWETYIDDLVTLLKLSRSRVVMKLRDIVARPTKERVRESEGCSKVIESCLLVSNCLSLRYLKDASQWFDRLHPNLQAAFGHGR